MPARTDPDYRRLVALHACAILETPAEDTFDQLARLAAHLCGAAVAAIGFMDAGREWFKASAGMELGTLQNLAGDHSLCRLALGGRLVQVEDAQVDPVLRSHPLVQGPSRMRMAACMPIKTTDGLTLGAVVVLDTARRALEESHREALVAIASQAMALLELRRQRRDVARRAQERAPVRRAFPPRGTRHRRCDLGLEPHR